MKHPFILVALLAVMPLIVPAQSLESAPLIAPDAERMSLDEVGLYAVGYQYRGKEEKRFPDSWSGGFEALTGVALEPSGEQDGRATMLMHPPWRGGTGITFQEFRFQLPTAAAVQHILLTGATAMRKDAIAGPGEKQKSDGATFRILANGRMLLDENRADAQWKPFSFDLTGLAGQNVTLRFETDPGPRNNSAFDFALWGDRELVLEGFVPKPAGHPAPPPLDLRRLYPVQNGEVASPSGFAGKITTTVGADNATLTYSGPDGTLEYQWTRPVTPGDPPLGLWRMRATQCGAKAPDIIPLAGDAHLEWAQTATFKGSQLEAAPGGAVCISTFEVNGHTATLRYEAKLSGKSLVLEVSCDDPQIAGLEAGRWGPVLHRRPVTAPYYSGHVFYLERENLFVNGFLDWTKSSASFLENSHVVYGVRTDGTRVPLHERVVFSAAWHVEETLPNIPNPPSPFRGYLAGKIVLDIWGGRFEDVARNLETLHDYGLNNCLAIVHIWQRSGYDNALPAHVPANAALGSDAGMKNLTATAKRLGYDIALHENYVDYYPNYEGFNPDDLSLDSNGKRVLAWYNAGTKIQSFAIQPHAILPLARQQSPQIQALYAPNADYLDVHSAVTPWFHVDFRAGAEGAGMFQTVWNAHRQLWAYERATHGGPVLGEGNNHWYWSGLLDGAEAQFGAGWPYNEGQTAPLMVDFDLLKIHPLQFNHGMGYYERWWGAVDWGTRPPIEVLDQYRMQEVIYGHAGFLGHAAYSDVPLAWLEHHLMSPVTARYANALPVKIEYQVHGNWVDGTEAAKAGIWKRVRVTYDNGLIVTANDDAESLRQGSVILPQYGWIANGAGVTAWTALLQDVIADYARTEESTFANARALPDWDQSGIHRIRPTVAEFRQTGDRSFALSYAWRVGETLPRDYNCLVHFAGIGDTISFQNDHPLPRPSSTWRTGETLRDGPHDLRLPDNLPDGDYAVRIGLYLPETGRLALEGRIDGENRIRAGTLHVRGGGRGISFEPEPPASGSDDDIYRHRLNAEGKVLEFGDVRTDGGILVRREDGEWVLRALPRSRDFFVELNAEHFGRPASVRCVDGPASMASTQAHGHWWQLELNGAREYRWK
jgi:hypothetical protein